MSATNGHVEQCIACGEGMGLMGMTIWRDADGEGWWIHPDCRENLGTEYPLTEQQEAHRPSKTAVPRSLAFECSEHVGCTGCDFVSYDCKKANAYVEHAEHVASLEKAG